jgi:hypothetical protein
MGIREIQRKLEFSSPTLAVYHLDKLENLKLVEKTEKGYILTKEIKVGALAQMIKFGGLLFPRYTFYVNTTCSIVFFICQTRLFQTFGECSFTDRQKEFFN